MEETTPCGMCSTQYHACRLPKHRVTRLKVASLREQNVNESVNDLSYFEQTDGVWESPGCRRVSSLKPVAKVLPRSDCLFRTVTRALLVSRVLCRFGIPQRDTGRG